MKGRMTTVGLGRKRMTIADLERGRRRRRRRLIIQKARSKSNVEICCASYFIGNGQIYFRKKGLKTKLKENI